MGWDRMCSDPRDRIYGLVGLMPEGLQKRIVSDYTLPVGEIYKSATLESISYFSRLELFRRFASLESARAIDAPSWVPDLIPSKPKTRGGVQFLFTAGMSPCEAQYTPPSVLSVCGVKGGVVVDVKPRLTSAMEDGPKEAIGWRPQSKDAPYPGGGTMMEAYLMLLAGLDIRERFPNGGLYPTLEQWKEYHYHESDDGKPLYNEYTTYMFTQSLESLLFDRTMFTIEGGYIGLGPVQMRPGTLKLFNRFCD